MTDKTPVAGYVALADLTGWSIDHGDDHGTCEVYLEHHCGFQVTLSRFTDFSVVGLVGKTLELMSSHDCPSRERVARWAAAAGHTPARAGHLAGATQDQTRNVLGDAAADQLDAVRGLSRRRARTDGPWTAYTPPAQPTYPDVAYNDLPERD